MPDESSTKMPEHLLKLVEGLSTYNKVVIQFWLAIAFFSILAISPTFDNDKVKMLSALPDLPKEQLYPFAFVVICILIIGFGSAVCQAFRSRKLMQRVIDVNEKKYIVQDKIFLQDIIDSMSYPALNRVAPLAQILYGQNQFFPDTKNVSKSRRILVRVYYTLLKTFATIIMYGLPIYALLVSILSMYCKDRVWGLPIWIFWALGVFAVGILIELLIVDINYTFGVWKHLGTPKEKILGDTESV
jgi:hypothetical protein